MSTPVEPEERKKKQSQDAARRSRAKRKREGEQLKEDHERLSRQQSRMVTAIIRLKATLQSNKVKIPDLGLEVDDLNSVTEGDPITALAHAAGRRYETKNTKVPMGDLAGIQRTLDSSEHRIIRRVRIVQEKLDELTKLLER